MFIGIDDKGENVQLDSSDFLTHGVILGRTGSGKGHPISTKVLTPTGWKTVGSLKVGDFVVGSNGLPTCITGIFDRGRLPVYRVEFSDDASVVVDGEHLWAVTSSHDRAAKRGHRIVSTQGLLKQGLAQKSGRAKWQIPIVKPVAFQEAELPVDPYIMGVLLGDGQMREHGVNFTSDDERVVSCVTEALPDSLQLCQRQTKDRSQQWGLVGKNWRDNSILSALREFKLLGKRAWEKFIPEPYLFASLEQRIALLQGLMDTDGEVTNDGFGSHYTTSSPQLAEDIVHLIRSVGGIGYRSIRKAPVFTYLGVKKVGRTSYRITPSLPSKIIPFRARQGYTRVSDSRSLFRTMTSIESAGVDDVVCIAVEAEDNLYVTEDLIVTHNTGLTVAILEEIAAAGSSAIVFDPKGDLTNMALSLSEVRDYEDWVEPGVDAHETFLEREKDLADFGLSHDSVEIWKNKIKVIIYAPGKTYGGGRSINVFPTFDVPYDGNVPMRERASSEVGSVLEAVGHSSDPYDPALVFLTEAVLLSWGRRRSLPIDYWPGMLCAPPEQLQEFGGMALDEFLPKRSRTKLARKLIGFRHQADRWLNGERFDLEKFTQGDPKLAVFTLRHLDEEERHFFTGLFMNKLVDFMFETPASQRLKLLVVLDEARGYLPPYPHNPPTKQPICTILAQGRAQGIGMLIGTQNPMDLDYKALSNVGTWFIGKLRERDCNRDLASELKSRAVDISEVENMKQRSFLLLDRRGDHHKFRVRPTLNYLRGPIGANDLLRLNPKSSPPPPVARLIKVSAALDDPKTRARRKFWGRIFGWDRETK